MELVCFNCKAKENLHNAPQTIEMRRKWMELIPDAYGSMFDSYFRLCSDHFDSKCITRDGKLSTHAVPTKFIVHNVWFEVEQESCEKNLFDRTGLTDSPFNGDLINILSKINSPTMDLKYLPSIENTPVKADADTSSSPPNTLNDNKTSVEDYLYNNSLLGTLNNIEFPLAESPKSMVIFNAASPNSPPITTRKNDAAIKSPPFATPKKDGAIRSPPTRTNNPVASPTITKKNVSFTSPAISETSLTSPAIAETTAHTTLGMPTASSCRIISDEKIHLPRLKQVAATPSPRKLKVCFVLVKRLKTASLAKNNDTDPGPGNALSPIKDELQNYRQELIAARRFNSALLGQLRRFRTKASKLRAFLEELKKSGIILKKDKPNKNM